MPKAITRPGRLPKRRDRETQGEGRLKAHRELTMGIAGVFGVKAGRVEIGNRPTYHQQALLEEVHENGDPSTSTPYREARRPIGVLRSQRRVLRDGHQPKRQRSIYGKLKWAVIVALRAPYGVVAKSLRFSKTTGRIRKQATGSGVDNRVRENEQVE